MWQPREHEQQQLADDLSKLPDGSAWALNAEVFAGVEEQLFRMLVNGVEARRRFTIDLFADWENCKVFVDGVPRFFSRWCCPGSAGIDAFAHRWDVYWCPQRRRWRRHMGYCNGPFDCMGSILRKVLDDRADVVLVYPLWPRYWRAVLQQLRHLGVVRAEWELPMRGDLFLAGARVPASSRGAGYKRPHYKVYCAVVTWDQESWLPPPRFVPR